MQRLCHFLFFNLLVSLILPAAAMAQVIVGPGPGGDPEVLLIEPGGTRTFPVFYPWFLGAVSVTLGDVNGDGTVDIIAGAGPGGGPHVRVLSGVDLTELASFYAFDPAFSGGVHVASGDVNGDGRADLIVGAGAGGGPHVRVFSGVDLSELASFYAYSAAFAGGVTVAAGDVDGDGLADIITGAGAGGGPHVRVFSGADLRELASFYAYDADFGGGVSVAAGDFDGDGLSDVVTGAGPGGGPHVRVFSGLDLAELVGFYGFDPVFGGGVNVAVGDINDDGRVDLILAAGPGGGPHVRILSGVDFSELDSFFAPANMGSGISIGSVGEVLTTLPPTLDPIADPAPIAENAGLQTVNLTGITAGPAETQPLQVTADSSNLSLVPNPTVTYTSPSSTGSLAYTPSANQFGTAIVTVTVTDGGLDGNLATPGDNRTFSRQFTVTVTGLNEPPTLDPIANPAAITEDAGQQTVNVTGITAGSGETQPLLVTAVSNNLSLILNPTVTYTSPGTTGSVAYTPVADASGSAIVTVTVSDGGLDDDLGTAGDNGTTTRTFTVVVNPADDPPTLDPIANPAAINEDAGAQMVNLSGIAAGGGESQALTVTATSNTPGLIPHPTVTYTSPGATGSLTYTPVANASGSAIVTVRVTDAGAGFVERTFTVTVNPVNDAPVFTAGASQTVAQTAGPQTVAAWATGISAGPGEAGQTLTFVVTNNSDPSLFAAGPAVAADGTLTYTPASAASGTATITVALTDNGGTANGGVDQSPAQTFSITVTDVNDPPTLDAIPDPTAILEDAGPQTVNLSGITAGPAEAGQPLQVTASSNNTGFIPNPTVTYTSPAATGSLSYTPVANASGSAVITVTVTDGGLDDNLATPGDNGSVVRTFTVTVTSVNDAPSFTVGANQTVLEDAGPQTVTPFATSISPGPGESDAVTFVVTNNTNPGLFATAPAISVTGTLTYTTAANQHGVATITVQLTDNGGTANGGVNQSATQQFTITVTPVNDAPVAVAKAFTAQANLLIGYTINLAANGSGDVTDVDNNDPGFTTQAFTLTSVAALSCAGCVATITSGPLGTFTFEPPPGQTGTFTLTYRVTDNGNPMPGVQSVPGAATGQPGVITITVNGPVVWFVDSTAPVGGNGTWTGTNAKAFQTLAQADAVNVVLNDRVFVLNNSLSPISYADADGFTMPAGERLIGQGVTGASFDTVVLGVVAPAGTAARPAINGVRPVISNTVTLADGATVTGINFTPSGAFAAMSGSGLATASAITIDQVMVTGGTSALSLTNVANSVTVTNASFTNTSGAEVLINQGTGNVSIAATITSNAGRSIDIQNRTGGTVTFTGAITDTGSGVFLNANTGSTINFTGGLSLTTTTNPGFTATGGGTVSATQNNTTILNTITTTTGRALNVANTTIGASRLTFRSISSSGGSSNGIILDTTGASGGLTVEGDGVNTTVGGNASGGTIANKSGADGSTADGSGIYLNSTTGVILRRMTINGTNQNFGIRGVNVTGFTMEYSTVSGTNGTSAGIDEGSVNFDNLLGSAAITSSLIEGGFEDNLNVVNASGTLNRLTITGSTFGFNNTVSGNNNILIESQNAGTTLNFTIQSSTIKGARADWINASNNSTSTMNAIIGGTGALGNTFDNLGVNAHAGAAAGGNRVVLGSVGTMTFDVNNNTLRGSKGEAIRVRSTAAGATTGIATGYVRNNVIGIQGTANSGSSEGSGIFAFGDGGSDMTIAITGNTVHQYNNTGISMTFGDEINDGSVFNATVTGNTVNTPGTINTDFNAIQLNHGTVAATDNFTSCVDIGGAGALANSVANAGSGSIPPNNADIRLRQRQSTTVRLPGYGGANNNDAAVVTYLTGRNTLITAAASNTVPTGGGFIGGGACTLPPF